MAKKFYLEYKGVKLPHFLHDQFLRACSSVALNLSEGSGRRTPADKRRHFTIAFGSLQECRSILEIEGIEDPLTLSLLLFPVLPLMLMLMLMLMY